MKVIGAGLPRTGTASLKKALELLGFGPCYHMGVAMTHSDDRFGQHSEVWGDYARARGEKPVPVELFDEFGAGVDFPSSAFYKELSSRYPEAKIVLGVRSTPEDWVKSYQTLMSTTSAVARVSSRFKRTQDFLALRDWLEEDYFANLSSDAERRQAYIDHNEAVLEYFGASRVLVHKAQDGWAPLCEHLNVPVPNQPYPKSNSSLGLFTRLMKAATQKDVDLDEALG